MKHITLILLTLSVAQADDTPQYNDQYGRQPSIFASPGNDDMQRQVYQQQQRIIRQQQEMQNELRRQEFERSVERNRRRIGFYD